LVAERDERDVQRRADLGRHKPEERLELGFVDVGDSHRHPSPWRNYFGQATLFHQYEGASQPRTRSITRNSRSMRSSLRSQRSGWAAKAGVVAPNVAAAISEARATRQRFRVMPIMFRAHGSVAVTASLALSERGAGSRRTLGSQHA